MRNYHRVENNLAKMEALQRMYLRLVVKRTLPVTSKIGGQILHQVRLLSQELYFDFMSAREEFLNNKLPYNEYLRLLFKYKEIIETNNILDHKHFHSIEILDELLIIQNEKAA